MWIDKKPRFVQGYDAYTTILTRLADIGAVTAAGWLAYIIRFGDLHILEERYQWAILASVLMTAIILPMTGVYQSWRGRVRQRLLLRLAYSFFFIGLCLTFVLYFFGLSVQFSRIWIASLVGLSFGFSVLIRCLAYPFVNSMRLAGKNRRQVLLIGDAHSCAKALRSLKDNPTCGFDVSRVLLVDEDEKGELAGSEELICEMDITSLHACDEREIWICLSLLRGSEINRILSGLSSSVANIRLVPSMGDFRLINHNISQISNLFMLDVSCSPMSGMSAFRKRMEDVLFSSVILLAISPVLLALMALVKITSPGPVFYRQERVSWNGKPFQMLKFRSMPVNLEKGGATWGGAKVKQTTSIGRWLRSTSLDELPQFINVLKGDMSIVGPRPERTVFVEQFSHEIPGYMQKHMMKAGITGWAQINGWRGDTDLHKRIECDLWYIEHWSVLLDLKIIFMTIFKGFIGKNAY